MGARHRGWAATVVAVAVAVAWIAGAGSAAACSCVVPQPPNQAMAAADAVFIGTVVDAGGVAHQGPERGLALVRYRMEVSEVFKGPVPALVDIHTPDGGGSACGYGFEVGRAELVYASRHDGGPLTASSCSRTIPADMAEADLRVLGDGVAPGPATVPAPVATGPGWLLPLAAALLLLVVVPAATWALLRSGRQDRPLP